MIQPTHPGDGQTAEMMQDRRIRPTASPGNCATAPPSEAWLSFPAWRHCTYRESHGACMARARWANARAAGLVLMQEFL